MNACRKWAGQLATWLLQFRHGRFSILTTPNSYTPRLWPKCKCQQKLEPVFFRVLVPAGILHLTQDPTSHFRGVSGLGQLCPLQVLCPPFSLARRLQEPTMMMMLSERLIHGLGDQNLGFEVYRYYAVRDCKGVVESLQSPSSFVL